MLSAVISIDIGEKNLGYTIATAQSFDVERSIADVNFVSNVYNLETKPSRGDIVVQRVNALGNFVEKITKDLIVELVIIERQVPSNPIAMELMYSICSFFALKTQNVIIFDPKLKFNKIQQVYNTKNKAHKKLSIENMRKILDAFENESFGNLARVLDDLHKRDDVADSFNQLLISCAMNGYLKLTLEDIKSIVN